MPVKFRGVSEYSSTYKWAPSYRSPKFEPTFQQSMPEAGLRSDEMTLLVEPNFTKKRQVPHRQPETAGCLTWWYDNEIDRDNIDVDAGEKTKADAIKKMKTYMVKKKRNLSESNQGRKVKSDKNKTLTKNTEERGIQVQNNVCVSDSRSTWERANVNVVQANKEQASQKTSPKTRSISVKKSVSKEASPIKSRKNKEVTPKTSPTKQPKQSPSKSVNVKSAPLRYRPLQHRMLRSSNQSEYQHMFKRPTQYFPSSPLLSAVDVVYKSSAAIPPHKSPKMLSKSEYASKFYSQTPLSKSPPFTSPASPSQKLKVKNLPFTMLQQHRSPRQPVSEYANQFPEHEFPATVHDRVIDEAQHNKLNREGSIFDRDHMNQLLSPTNKYWDLASVTTNNSTVLANNKKPDNILDKQLDASDVDEPKDSQRKEKSKKRTKELSAKTCGGGIISKQSSDSVTESNEGNNKATMVVSEEFGRKLSDSVISNAGSTNDIHDIESIDAMEKDSLDTQSAVSSRGQSIGEKPVARRLAWGEYEDDDCENISNDGTSLKDENLSVMSSANDFEGRLPTPQLSHIGGGLRTHHDITTPCIGGALLTSPTNKVKKSIEFTSSRSPRLNNATVKERSRLDENMKVEHLSKTDPSSKRFNNSNLPRRMQHTIRAPIRGSLRDQEFQHFSGNSRPTSAFDRVSLASYRSSASVHELLEKSMQRKDFWAK